MRTKLSVSDITDIEKPSTFKKCDLLNTDPLLSWFKSFLTLWS